MAVIAAEGKARPSPGPSRHGRFISFEGGEGAGKSTQIGRLAARLAAAGFNVVTTREPGGTPEAERVREFLLSGKAKHLGPEVEAVLFAAARANHVDKLIRPALDRGDWVLTDRFFDSTRAYQGAGSDERLLTALERVAAGTTRPDLTLILDVPAEIGLARAAERRGSAASAEADRFEKDDLAVHERRRQAFLGIAAAEPLRCVVIDATLPPETVEERIWQAVAGRFLAGES